MCSQGELLSNHNSHLRNLSQRSSLPLGPLLHTFGPSRPGPTKSCNSSRRSSLGDTCMEVESAVLFNVNPPSPQGSDYYSDEQDTILRTWQTGGGPLVEPLQYPHSMPHHLAEKGYCGIITSYEYAASFDPDSINTLAKNSAQSTDMSFVPYQGPGQDHRPPPPLRGSPGAVGGFRAGEGSSNPPPGYPRKGQPSGRRGPGESSRKSELYKTELCISLSTGNPCRYKKRLCSSSMCYVRASFCVYFRGIIMSMN